MSQNGTGHSEPLVPLFYARARERESAGGAYFYIISSAFCTWSFCAAFFWARSCSSRGYRAVSAMPSHLPESHAAASPVHAPCELRTRSSAREAPHAQLRPRSSDAVGTSDAFYASSVPSHIFQALHIIIFHLRPARSSVQGAPAAQLRAVDTSDSCNASSVASDIHLSLYPITFHLRPVRSSVRGAPAAQLRAVDTSQCM